LGIPVVDTHIVQYLREPPGRGQPPDRSDRQSEAERVAGLASEEEPYLLCRDCLHPIARPADRIRIQGRHAHTFANPHGLVFEIGCFQSAPGCGAIGPPSDEFTWFAGYRWRVGICAACLLHLGWVFLPAVGTPFYGLILDRLIESSH
jgi:hypothetical protein